MRHSMSKDTAFNGETTPRHTFLFSDLQCLPPGDPRILCAKHGYPITGKSLSECIAKNQPGFLITYNVELSLFKQCLQAWKIKDTYFGFFGKKVAMNISKITIY